MARQYNIDDRVCVPGNTNKFLNLASWKNLNDIISQVVFNTFPGQPVNGIVVQNGLNSNTANNQFNIELGGPLLKDTTINGQSGFSINFIELFNLCLEVTNQFLLKYPVGEYQIGAKLTPIDIATGEVSWRLPNNGLSVNINGNTELGGTLLKNTNIVGNAFDLSIDQLSELLLSGIISSIEGVNALDVLSDNLTLIGESFLNVRTPNVVGNTAVDGQILTLIDSTTGESEFKNKKTVLNFVSADWVSGVKIDILATTHNQGTNPIVQVLNSTEDVIIPGNSLGLLNTLLETIKINASGDITLICDTPFDGKIIIL
jgi:hypothetical protein